MEAAETGASPKPDVNNEKQSDDSPSNKDSESDSDSSKSSVVSKKADVTDEKMKKAERFDDHSFQLNCRSCDGWLGENPEHETADQSLRYEQEEKEEQGQVKVSKTRSHSRSRSREGRHRRSRGHHKSRHGRRRSHSRSRRRGHGRRRSRSHSHSRRHRRHRSSSRSRHRRRRSRSRQRRRRSRSRSPEDKGRKSSGLVVGFSRRSRSRSRDGPRSNFHRRRSPGSPRTNPIHHNAFMNEKKSFKEQMREQFMQAGLALGATNLMAKQGSMDSPGADTSKPLSPSELVSDPATLNLLPNMSEEDLSKLASKNPQVARVLLMRSRAEALTGVTVPKYYSLSAVNPLKYAEQMQKRKMLWSGAKDTQQKNEALWTASSAAVAGTGEEASRFRKLMGIKDKKDEHEESIVHPQTRGVNVKETVSVVKKQEELFRNLDKEYELARVATHSARGVGLGYSSQSFIDPNQFQR